MPLGPLAFPNLSDGVDTSSKGERHWGTFFAGTPSGADDGAFAAPSPMTATTSPTLAVTPGPTRISDSRPPTIACTSIVTLSVSTSNRLSPSLISSPTDLNQARILPSATVSPSWGIMMIEDIGLPVQHAPHRLGDARRARQREILEMIGSRQRYVRG